MSNKAVKDNVSYKGKCMFSLFEFHLCLSLFEIDNIWIWGGIEYKPIEGIYRIFLKGRFRCERATRVVVCTIIPILSIKSTPRGFATTCETTVISRLNTNPSHNVSFTEVYKRCLLLNKSITNIHQVKTSTNSSKWNSTKLVNDTVNT